MASVAAPLSPLSALAVQHSPPKDAARFPPINFIYGHFHNSIRAELGRLAERVRSLEAPGEGVEAMLSDLRERYKFLEQVYKYHSAVEDEVVYPVLDSKVRNVTLAYSIEHQDEEALFEQLIQLLKAALEEPESKRKCTIRTLICKVEEVHTTLRKHLAKEEEQLLPLLLQHFTFAEQAELVAQFLYSIPLETVERVLSQLKPLMPREEQEQLLEEIRSVIPDNLLSQLLTTWLQPAAAGDLHVSGAGAGSGAGKAKRPAAFACCGNPAACAFDPRVEAAGLKPQPPAPCAATCQPSGSGACSTSSGHLAYPGPDSPPTITGPGPGQAQAAQQPPGSGRAPLQEIIHFHRSICAALADFAKEARALQVGREAITAGHLSSLLDRHRFLRSVYVFHSISEEEVLFPEVQRLATAAVGGVAAQQCEKDHQSELSSIEDLGRLLADVRAFARRGRKEVASMLEKLCCSAEAVHSSIEHHMQREEADVFPLLEAHLCEAQQRALVYRTIRAMPLRLLERVMPWVVSRLDNAAASVLLSNIRLGAPLSDQALVELLSRWARRGRRGLSPGGMEAGAVPTALGASGGGAQAGAAASGPGDSTVSGTPLGPRAESGEAPEVGAGPSAPEDFQGADHAARCAATCGPRLLRDSASAQDGDSADCKRRRLGAGAGPEHAGPGGSTAAGGTGASRQHSGSMATGGPDGDAAMAGYSDEDGAEEAELSTAPRALLRAQGQGQSGPLGQAGSPDDLGAGPGPGSDRAGGDADGADTTWSLGDGSRRSSAAGGPPGGSAGGYNPIDHIFQFHKALRQELKQLEADAMALEAAVLVRVRHQHSPYGHTHHHHVHHPTPQRPGSQGASLASAGAGTGPHATTTTTTTSLMEASPPQRAPTPAGGEHGAGRAGLLPVMQHLHGRFQFLQGIYRAHSKAEDEIVFPALEAKQALRNVSHAYTLDHRQEEQLFADLEEVIDALRSVDLNGGPEAEQALSRQVMSVRRMCAAIRASLETHIRSEESELWPLFTEHFSRTEQQYLVGVIIGRTGAQVLQALLPWVSETFSQEEKEAMMDSLREATRNTMFDQWLEAVQAGGVAGGPPGPGPAPAAAAAHSSAAGRCPAHGPSFGHAPGHASAPSAASRSEGGRAAAAVSDPQPLRQVAEYLAGGPGGPGAGPGGPSGAGPGSSVADAASFRPGWEDIFRMNQQQLEAAIHRVSNDSSLEPERKAYLMQNIMVSKYIVAQQRRMMSADGTGSGSSGLGAGAGGGSGAGGGAPAGPGSQGAGADGGCRACLCGELGPVSSPPAALSALGAVAAATHLRAPSHSQTWHNEAAGVLGCQHYQRRCQLVAPCCDKVFTCRLCHDEASDHRMDRYAVSEMRCMLCGERQPVAGTCRACSGAMARYVCNICHLFDDEPGKDIYHCPFCNVCRRGRGLGVDFFHCMNCNACMSLSLFSAHKCREKCIEGNCPVCHEALFDSSQPIKELPCGHFMHSTCFLTYTRYNYTCPLCCKSVGDMSVYFQMLDSLLASERLPPEYAGRMQQVLCNDCGKMGFAPFHFVYHSCPHCRSYNTRVM